MAMPRAQQRFARLLLCAALAAITQPSATLAEESTDKPKPGEVGRTWTESDCKKALAAATGGKKIEGVGWAEAETISDKLITCNAVGDNSAATCDALAGNSAQDCQRIVSIFQELRREPKGRGYLFSESDHQRCKSEKEMAPHCDGIRQAALTADPDQCPEGMMKEFCRALVSLDSSMCDAVKVAGGDKECRTQIAKMATYGGGIEELAKSGSEPMQTYARAARDGARACKALSESFEQACIDNIPEVGGTKQKNDSQDNQPADDSNEQAPEESGKSVQL